MKVLRRTFSSRYAWIGAALAMAAAGGLGFWFREQIVDAWAPAQDMALTTMGLGLVTVAVWLLAFTLALAIRRSWFRRVNLWLGSLILLAFALGALDLFEAPYGALAWATLDGEVSLGGRVGEAVAGPHGLMAGLRLAALFVVGVAIAAPTGVAVLVTGLGRVLVQGYVVSVLAAKAAVSGLRRMYRVQPDTRFSERGAAARRDESRRLKDALGPHPVSSVRRGLPSGAPSPQPGEMAVLRQAHDERTGVQEEGVSGRDEMVVEQDVAVGAEGETLGGVPGAGGPAPHGGKFNQFWASQSPGPLAQNAAMVRHFRNMDDDERDDGPVVDRMAASWALPTRVLLKDAAESGISEEEIADTAETIRRTLAEYSVEVEIGQTKPGPTVTMYGLVPGWIRRFKQVRVTDEEGNPKLDESGKPMMTRAETKTRVKVDTIMSREKDLALALKTPSLRIETPALGKSLVGIEVPNPSPALVTLRGVMESEEFKELRSRANLPIALGRGSGGEAFVVDLARMPHLLVAGATGSGKSVCINSIVSCLIMEKTPAEMRLLLVDPKRVELTPYNGIPHLLTPVVVETDQVVALLKGLIREMLSRYRRLEEVGVRNIESHNRKIPDKMPYLVVAVDELADLMMSASFDVERTLCRLAQLGRATGIHLIVATQRPSVDVVTGLIKANFPSRISFGVTSQIDSRTILDTVGAEKLLGRGDMLYQGVDASRPSRVQGVFISDGEIHDLVEFWQSTPWAPLPKVSLHAVGDEDADEGDAEYGDEAESRDEFLDKAIELAHSHNKLSTSLLQRRLRIGYPRAARLMDQLEDAGIVGPGDGSKSRDVIMGGI